MKLVVQKIVQMAAQFKCKICGAWHGGRMPDPHICPECWKKGHR